MPNDVCAAILDPHEPQSLTPVLTILCQSFSLIVTREAKENKTLVRVSNPILCKCADFPTSYLVLITLVRRP